MTISSRSIPRIEYRDGETGTLCIAEPGRVFVHAYQMKSSRNWRSLLLRCAKLPAKPNCRR
jgi:hypothetical protein